ncbi:Cytochrome P450-like protein 57 [Elsinoe fawcettii]|nr:Cytochrome P450-like protein 57 [Elsinoe fawcettii]
MRSTDSSLFVSPAIFKESFYDSDGRWELQWEGAWSNFAAWPFKLLIASSPFLILLWKSVSSQWNSSFRHVPAVRQSFFLLRLLHEPTIEEIEHWMDNTPNQGLLRYRGLFNQERLLVTSPAAARELLQTSAYNFIKPDLQRLLVGQISNRGLIMQEGDEHRQAKKVLAPAFQPQRVVGVYPEFYKIAAAIQRLVSEQSKQEPRDRVALLRLISAATLQSIGEWAFSEDFEALTNPNARFARSYTELLKTTHRGQKFLWLLAIVGAGIMRLPPRAAKTIKGVVRYINRTSAEIVERRERLLDEADRVAPDDMLTHMIRSGRFSHEELARQTQHFLAVSTETSAGSITWAIHLLSRHPDVQARLREEVRVHLPSPHKLVSGEVDDQAVSSQVFDRMPYLHAVMKEVFRFHSITGILWKECVEPTSLVGTEVPVGTKIGFSPWMAGRGPQQWGADSRHFRPERWMNSSSGGANDAYAFLTFGAGPRRCIGEQYAYAQFKTFIAALIGRFEFKTLNLWGTDVGKEIGSDFALTLFKIIEGWETYVEKVEGW